VPELKPATQSRTSRRGALIGAAATLFASQAQAICPPAKVLFVCPAGTVKSAIARETLRRRASLAKLAIEVRSRGIDPQDHVSAVLKARLAADGIDPAAEPARALTTADLQTGQIVIAFDEAALDPRLAGARVWKVPSWNEDYATARAALTAHIDALLQELRDRGCASPAAGGA